MHVLIPIASYTQQEENNYNFISVVIIVQSDELLMANLLVYMAINCHNEKCGKSYDSYIYIYIYIYIYMVASNIAITNK